MNREQDTAWLGWAGTMLCWWQPGSTGLRQINRGPCELPLPMLASMRTLCPAESRVPARRRPGRRCFVTFGFKRTSDGQVLSFVIMGHVDLFAPSTIT